MLDDARITSARRRMAHAGELCAIVAEIVRRSTAFRSSSASATTSPPARCAPSTSSSPTCPWWSTRPPARTATSHRRGASRPRRHVRRPAPMLGEHTREVLAELGYDDAEIGALTA
ncbi:MAG: hypothetical protein R2713_09355 [Ilumatobacteraceae bacterium]